jgi:hypothetical protein
MNAILPEKNVFRGTVRFECRGCGNCCKVRGDTAYVYLTAADRRRLARHLGMGGRDFIRAVCVRIDGHYYIGDSKRQCRFLEGNRCSVYPARPHQCRTWPFWPVCLNPAAWVEKVRSVCLGAGPHETKCREAVRTDPEHAVPRAE